MLLCCLITFIVLQQQKINSDKLSQTVKLQSDSLNLAESYHYSLSYSNLIDVPLHKDMIVTDAKGSKILIPDLIDSSLFIYHFDETNCFTCVEKYIPYLNKLKEKIGPNKIIIIGSYSNAANLFVSLAPYKLMNIPIYNLHPSYLSETRVGSLNAPYIFEVDSALHTQRFFIPEKHFPELSLLYHKLIPY